MEELPAEVEDAAAAAAAAAARLPYREHAPMHKLLSKVPQRIHRGVRGYDLNLTCLAAHPRFLALGVNAGLVYWYDRENDQLTRLWCSDRRSPVCKLALVETVDLMLAAGSQDGVVTVFQIPRPVDANLFPCASTDPDPGQSTADDNAGTDSGGGSGPALSVGVPGAHMFTISGVHRRAISAMEWSRNGMRLFTGDEEGQIFVTELDFMTSTTCSSPLPLADENDAAVVQLSYFKQNLLVSTSEKSFVVRVSTDSPPSNLNEDGEREKTPPVAAAAVGSKPRGREGRYGGVFVKDKTMNMVVARPKNTLYLANVSSSKSLEVSVSATVLLGSQVRRPHADVPVLNPAIFIRDERDAETADRERDFAVLSPLRDGQDDELCLVAHNGDIFHIVRPNIPSVTASCSGLRRITDLSTCSQCGTRFAEEPEFHDEIFVLEGPRNLIRISRYPDPYQTLEDNKVLLDAGINPLGDDVPEGPGLESVSNNLISMSESVVSKLPVLQTAASEMLAPIAGGLSERLAAFGFAASAPKTDETDGESDPPSSPAGEAIEASPAEAARIETFQQLEGDEDDLLVSPETKGKKQTKKNSAKEETLTIESPDEAGGNMQSSLGKLKLELVAPFAPEDAAVVEQEDREEMLVDKLKLAEFLPGRKNVKEENSKSEAGHQQAEAASVKSREEDDSVSSLSNPSLVYGPPSDASLVSRLSQQQQQQQQQRTSNLTSPLETPSSESGGVFRAAEQVAREHTVVAAKFPYDSSWSTFELPCPRMSTFFAHLGKILVTDSSNGVFVGELELGPRSDKILWRNGSFKSDRVRISPGGKIFWRGLNSKAFALKNFNNADSWFEVEDELKEFEVNDYSALLLRRDGKMVMQRDLGPARPFSDKLDILTYEEPLANLTLCNGLLLALTEEGGALVGRVGVSKTNQSGNAWIKVESAKSYRFSSVSAASQLVGTRMVFKVVGVTRSQELLYAHGSQDDFFFDKDLQWHHVALKGVTGAENAVMARISESMLLVGSPLLPHLLCCTDSFAACHWRPLSLAGGAWRAKHLAAGGLYKHEGVLWIVTYSAFKPGSNDLYFCKFHDRKLHRVKLPSQLKSPLAAVAAAPEALWILSARGEIFMRLGITVDLPEGGGGWSSLDLSQLESEGAGRLRSVSLGSDAAWSVDENGRVWMRLGSLCRASSPTAPASAWIPVDQGDDETPRFFRVAASASIHIVWALDERGRVYVRDGIFPDFRLGVGWVGVEGPDGEEEVVSISASEASVWALTRGGRAFARAGITPTNFIGDFWRPVPPPNPNEGDCGGGGGLSLLSASACDSAFGADSSSVPMELREESVSLSVPNIAKYNSAIGSPAKIADEAGTEDGWTLITR